MRFVVRRKRAERESGERVVFRNLEQNGGTFARAKGWKYGYDYRTSVVGSERKANRAKIAGPSGAIDCLKRNSRTPGEISLNSRQTLDQRRERGFQLLSGTAAECAITVICNKKKKRKRKKGKRKRRKEKERPLLCFAGSDHAGFTFSPSSV